MCQHVPPVVRDFLASNFIHACASIIRAHCVLRLASNHALHDTIVWSRSEPHTSETTKNLGAAYIVRRVAVKRPVPAESESMAIAKMPEVNLSSQYT